MTALDLLIRADHDQLARLGLDTLPDQPRAAKFDNRPTWDNTSKRFDNRPTWDNWNKK